MKQKITLNRLSEEIGISRTTIYKVLNNAGFVSDETREKVLEAVEKYDYVPNYNARDLAKGKSYRIAYIGMYHLSAKYFSVMVKKGLDLGYENFVDHGLELLVAESEFDNPHKQLDDIIRMQKEGVKNFIIAPTDEFLLRDKVQELKSQHCNVILLSRGQNFPHKPYIGVNYYQSGKLVGEMLSKILPDGGRVVIMTNNTRAADSTVNGRYMGFMEWLKSYPKLQVVEIIEDINTDEQAVDTFHYLRDKYNNFQELDAVYDITYKLNILAEKLSEIKLEHKIKLVGFDVYPEIVEYIRNSVIDFVVGQHLSDQAFDALGMLFRKVCYGNSFSEKDYYASLDIIVSSNLDYFI